MAEIIQFPCPVCSTFLQLPLSMAAQQGPCPHCLREIVAPDPMTGEGAYEVAIAAAEPEPEPFSPPPPPATVRLESEPEPLSAPAVTSVPSVKSRPGVLILSCMLTGTVAFVWGHALGERSRPAVPPAAPMAEASVIPAVVEPAVSQPEPVEKVVKLKIQPPAAADPAPPKSVSAAAEASLRAFLDAPDWAARCAYVLQPGKVRDAMEAYSHDVPDGPTAYRAISVKQSHIDEKTGFTFYIFYVATPAFPGGIPVAVQETPVGWLVDWQAFVEFRDGLFQKFADGPGGRNGFFHVGVTAADDATGAENDHFSCYLLHPPLADPRPAYLRKDSAAAAIFEKALASGAPFTPVVEIAKRATADGKSYLEVVKILATDWSPREM